MKIKCPHCGHEHEVNIGYIMGKKSTEAKKEAARENGKKGGRPRKDPQK